MRLAEINRRKKMNEDSAVAEKRAKLDGNQYDAVISMFLR